jgi:hypothetical protein
MSESRGSKEIAGSPSTEASARCFFYWPRGHRADDQGAPLARPHPVCVSRTLGPIRCTENAARPFVLSIVGVVPVENASISTVSVDPFMATSVQPPATPTRVVTE